MSAGRALRASACALACATAVAAPLAGCGRGEGDAEPEVRPGKPPHLVVIARRATCSDWKRASREAREAAIRRLREVVAGPHGQGRTLEDGFAYELIDGRCREHFAREFLLYEMYTRAAAFAPLLKQGR